MNMAELNISFETPQDLEMMKKVLIENGVDLSEMECHTKPMNHGVGSRIKTESRSAHYALKFAPFGLILGLILSLFFVFLTNDKGFFGNLLNVDLSSTLLASLISGSVFLFLGYKLGSEKKVSVIKYESGDGSKKNFSMTVRTKQKYIEQLQKIISTRRTSCVEIAYGA